VCLTHAKWPCCWHGPPQVILTLHLSYGNLHVPCRSYFTNQVWVLLTLTEHRTQISFSETWPECTTLAKYACGGFSQQLRAYTDFHPYEENPPMFTPTESHTASGIGSLHVHVTPSGDLYQNQFTSSNTIPGEIHQTHTPGGTQGSYASDPAGNYSQVIQPVETCVSDSNAEAIVSSTIYPFTSMRHSDLLSGLSGPSSDIRSQHNPSFQSYQPASSCSVSYDICSRCS